MLGKYHLRALAVSEILDTALRIYRTKFVVLAGIAALAMIPEGILELVLILSFPGEDSQRLQNSLTSFFSNIATLALIVAISKAYLGDDFSIRSSYSQGLKRFWSVVWADFLIGLAIVGPATLFACLLLAVPPLGILALLVLLPVIVFLSTRWSLSSQAIILENIGGADGLRRAWTLTKGYFWRVLGTSVAAGLLSFLLTIVPSLFVNFGFSFTELPSEVVQIIDLAVQQLGLIIILPFTVAVQVLIYYDLCIRKEGFDLMMRTEEPQPVD